MGQAIFLFAMEEKNNENMELKRLSSCSGHGGKKVFCLLSFPGSPPSYCAESYSGLTRNLPCVGWAPVPLTQNCIPTSCAKGHCLPGFSLSLRKDLPPDLKDDSANNPYLSYIPSQKGN
ncbi:uncharacterized protein GJ701_002120 [Geothlypis trichas]